jgi:predicted transcriptional regulator
MPNSPRNALLISVKPRFADALLSGSKTVELRRVAPKSAAPGDLVLLYASSPRRELVGQARVKTIVTASATQIWVDAGDRTGLTRDEFDAYFEDCTAAVAIHLEDVEELASARTLSDIRHLCAGVSPPQSFRYLSPTQVDALVPPAT